jgi:nitroreductase
MSFVSEKQILDLIAIGIQAPSADNSQPWYVQLIPNGFEILVRSEEIGKFCDADGMATQLAIGAMIENIFLYASSLGLGVKIVGLENYPKSKPNKSQTPPVTGSPSSREFRLLRMSFDSQIDNTTTIAKATISIPTNALIGKQSIENRHTDRNFYKLFKKIPETQIHFLQTESELLGKEFSLVSYYSRGNKFSLMKLVSLADTVRFTNERSHIEFGRVLRWNPKAQDADSGLGVDTLALDHFTLQGLKFSLPWARQKWMTRFGLHYLSVFRASWLLMWSSSETIALIHRGPTKDYIECGRVMERLWIKLNELGFAVQPLGALPLFFARLVRVDGAEFSLSEKQKIQKCLNSFQALTPDFDSQNDQLIMLFRIGFRTKTPLRSRRKLIESIIL